MNRHTPDTFEFTQRGSISAVPDNELMRPA